MRTRLLSAALVAGVLLVPAAAVGRPASGTVVKAVFNKTLKTTILVAARGRTVYLLTYDTKGSPTCARVDPGCPKIWPAVTSAGAPVAGAGVEQRLLGIVKGADGSRQVTYNRHPLYYYENDSAAGDVNGQACYGIWYVLSPRGAAIRKHGPQC